MVKIGLLIHGYNVLRQNWQEVVWGKAHKNLMGRLPKGAHTALSLKESVETIVFGTGSSTKDGKIEAAWMRDTLLERFFDLVQFPAFSGMHLDEHAREWIEKTSVLETKSKNTKEEARFAGEIFLEKGISAVILVSSPDHIPRCFRDTYMVYSQSRRLSFLTQRIFATPSQIPYSESSETLIIEPAHPKYSIFKAQLEN